MSEPREFWIQEDSKTETLIGVSNKKINSDARYHAHRVIWRSSYDEAIRERDEALALVDKLEKLLKDASEIMGDSTTYPDPDFQREVTDLGLRIGFGALIHAANYGWQQSNELKDYPKGGEFVFGPCKTTADNFRAKAKQALEKIAAFKNKDEKDGNE